MTPGPAGAARLRVGVDVGGTFTKAVAVDPRAGTLLASAAVPTTHHSREGVAAGVAEGLGRLVDDLGERRHDIELVAFSTTQAMNALLEGDVPRVGVIGLGAAPELRVAKRRTRIGTLALAPGRVLETEHEFLDAGNGLDPGEVRAAVDRLVAAGCGALAVSGAFAVDAPRHEQEVAEVAREAGLPVCMGHELTGTYGLETRTVSAAINASILPMVQRTASVVERALGQAGVHARLLVLRGDGGAMDVESFRRAPTFTIGSGPAAGVAAALQRLALRDAVVLECGGTSSNVSLVRGGRTVLRSLRVMGRPTAIRAVDSWVVGAAGGSLARLRRRRIAEVGPRSAHVAGLPYACFASAADMEDARAEVVAPRSGDPQSYATVVVAGRRYGVTATCAANALGLVDAGDHAHGSQDAALAAFAALGRQLGRSGERVAAEVLEGAVVKIAEAVREAARQHDLPADAPLVALGGAAGALAAEVARAARRPLLRPDHAEVLSSIGAALSLVGAEVTRSGGEPSAATSVAEEAERACVEAGAAPASVSVEVRYEPEEGVVRAVATGAVALEAGAVNRDRVDEDDQRRAAAAALQTDAARLRLAARTEFYGVFVQEDGDRVAVVDLRGAVPLAANARRLLVGDATDLREQLEDAIHGATMHLGVATIPPRVALIQGARILDMSAARRPEDILDGADTALEAGAGTAVAVVWR